MKLFGLAFWGELSRGFVRTSRKYPLAVVCGLLCALSFSVAIDDRFRFVDAWRVRWIALGICSAFGIGVFILAELLVDRLKSRLAGASLLVYAAGVAGLVVLYFWIPLYRGPELLDVFWIRILMLAGLVHLAIAVVPFFKQEDTDIVLWEYNKTIFTRFLLSAFFSAVFFGGVVLALVSTDKLFGLDVDEENYGRIWFFCAFVLNTYLFLGAFPDADERSKLRLDYPKWIHFFSKFILLPLVVIYFAILFAYTLKIVFGWSWPNGWVGLPVFVLSAVGGLTGLLIWPLAKTETEPAWAKSFWRFFFPLLIPLAILLLLALQRRVSDYGFTEIRYLGVILAFWILGICLYFTARPSGSFKAIPWSLLLAALVFSVGPLSPASVARKSQEERLNNILTVENLLEEGKLVSNPHEVNSATIENLRSIVRYLRGNYGPELFSSMVEGLKPVLPYDREPSPSDWMELPRHVFADAFVHHTGLTSTTAMDNRNLEVVLEKGTGVPIRGGWLAFSFQGYAGGGSWGELTIQGKTVQVVSLPDGPGLSFRFPEGKEVGNLDLRDWIGAKRPVFLTVPSYRQISLPAEDLTFEVRLENLGLIRIVARRMNVHRQQDDYSLISGDFWILVPQG